MTLLTRQTVLLAKTEVTYGTDPTPAAANAIAAFDVQVTPSVQTVTRPLYKATIGASQPIAGFKDIEISFKTELKGSGAAGTAPETAPLFKACAMEETVDSGVSVTYSPVSDDLDSVTIYVYKDGTLHKLHGGMGTFSIDASVGQITTISWTFQGKTAAESQTAHPGSEVYDSTVPVALTSAGLSYGGWSAIATKATLDIGNTVAQRPSMNESDGVIGYMITSRETKGGIDPEADPTTFDVWAALKAADSDAFSITIGATAGNICDIDCPACVLTGAPYGDRNGIVTHDLGFICAESSGDDEIAIVFT